MDGVVHPNVEQAIGRDRIRKALKRYENRPADEHRYGIVRSVNEDGSYEVLLDGDVQTSRCAQYGTALVGDRVLAVTKKDGRNDLIGRLGGEIGGGGTVVTKVDDVSNYIAGRVFAHAGTNDPAGALLCDGRAVSRREYWELFDAIGTTYGAGDGSSTFNLPNIESRTIIGESDGYALGATGGEEKHLLDETEAADYSMPYTNSTTSGQWDGAISGSVLYTKAATVTSFVRMTRKKDQQPFNVMQPYIVMRYFITTGKGDPVSGINPADYVVEWGSWEGGGTCRYEKYASGRCKIWGTICNEFFTTASGSRSFTVKLPFTLLVVESAVAASWSPKDVSYFGSVDASIRDLAEANASSFKLQLAWTETNANMLCGFEVNGTWKDSPASGGTETIAPTIAERFEGIEADILDMRTNKVLCATAAWMYASETMTLSEPISAQENGVVLVFSFHDGNTTQDSNWVHVPILKEFVARHSGQGTLVNMRGLTNENKGNKYLYITDTTIKGHDSNAAEGMSSDGTVYKNQRYLLRYVIGF